MSGRVEPIPRTRMSHSNSRIQRLACVPNNYPWGPIGQDSLVIKLAPNACSKDMEIKNDEHYAELWMGTHPTQPSEIYETSQSLSGFLAQHRELLGDAQKFKAPFEGKLGQEGHLPFLFKILCANQVHPNKELATKLHKENPDQFPDTNHKPEIAVCLSDRFLGFAGFRPEAQIKEFLSTVPEVAHLPSGVKTAIMNFIDGGNDDERRNLRNVFEEFIAMEGNEVEVAVRKFTQRVIKDGLKAFEKSKEIDDSEKARLVEGTGILEEHNPGDGSIFVSLFFMNLVELKKGEGMYVGADGIHAWLKGKDKDSTRLVARTMTAKPQPTASFLLNHETLKKSKRGNTEIYSTPFEEFSILSIKGEDELEPLSGPGVAIILDGKIRLSDSRSGEPEIVGETGSVYFVGAGTGLKVSGGGEVWMAFYDGDSGQVGAK